MTKDMVIIKYFFFLKYKKYMFLKRKGTKRMILELQKYLDLKEKYVVAISLFQEHQGKTHIFFSGRGGGVKNSLTTKQKVWVPPSPIDLLLIG